MKTAFAILGLLCWSCAARACLRDQIDDLAIRWSSQIVEAKLVEVSERIEMKAVIVKPPAGSISKEVSAVYYYRVYSFEVEKVIDSANNSVKPKHRIEVLRFFGIIDDPNSTAASPALAAKSTGNQTSTTVTACAQHLTRSALGHSFVLLLRPEQDIKMQKPPVWSDLKNLDPRDAEVHGTKGYAAIYLMPKDKATDAEMAKLRKVLTETRAAEKKVTDQEMRKQIDIIIHAASDAQAEPAIAALRNVGFKAVSHIKSARDKKETPRAGKERLAKLAIELSPTPLTIMIGESHE